MKINKFSYSLFIIIITMLVFSVMHFVLKIPLERLLYGLPATEFVVDNNINLLEIFQWVWIYFPIWLIGGFYVDNYYALQDLTMLRYKNAKTWVRVLFCDCLFMLIAYLGTLSIICVFSLPQINLWPALFITLHALFGWIVFIFIRSLFNSGIIALMFILFTEVFGILLGKELALPATLDFTAWGMYIRSDIYNSSSSFNVLFVISFQIIVCIIIMEITMRTVNQKRR